MRRLIPLAVFITIFAACAREQAGPTEEKAVPVMTATVPSGEFPDTITVVGTVESKREAVLSSKVTGVIQEFWVDEGDRVGKGKILLTIEDDDIQARKREAEQAKAEGAAALAEADAAHREARAAALNAGINLERVQSLYRDQAVTRKELDDAQTLDETAAAKVEQAGARINQVKAKIAQAEAEVAQADAMLGYTIIRSPYSGVVTLKTANKGEIASPGRPLLKVVDDSELRVSATVNEGAARGVSGGDAAKVSVDAVPGREIDGTVSDVVPAADPATRTFNIKVELPPAPGLLPGMFARVNLASGVRTAVLLPDGALADMQGVQGVYVVTPEGRLGFRAISLGGELAGRREVLSGLKGGERVVVGDTASLREGMKVNAR
ncbi:MAG TPA: efflux RND transporter periplasmic adaptor subunit [Nitrospirota bacterium]|nr:efflux RND transporter periplasmic adaptor subunit [Nitrospirota bacterium]